MLSGLIFRALMHFEFISEPAQGSILTSLFYMQLSIFPSTASEETVFSPLHIYFFCCYILIDRSAWVYFWAFYTLPLIYVSVYVPVQKTKQLNQIHE